MKRSSDCGKLIGIALNYVQLTTYCYTTIDGGTNGDGSALKILDMGLARFEQVLDEEDRERPTHSGWNTSTTRPNTPHSA